MVTEEEKFWEGFPAVEIIPGKVSGVPLLKWTRMPAEGVLDNADHGMSAEEIAEVFQLDVAAVRAVLLHALRRGYPPEAQ